MFVTDTERNLIVGKRSLASTFSLQNFVKAATLEFAHILVNISERFRLSIQFRCRFAFVGRQLYAPCKAFDADVMRGMNIAQQSLPALA